MPAKIAIIGSGPAGLMCASVLSQDNHVEVTVFDQHASPARKILIAGKTGLNITNNCNMSKLIQTYRGPLNHFKGIFTHFSNSDWVAFVKTLGFESFVGSGGRVLLREKNAAGLVAAWVNVLKKNGVGFCLGDQWRDFSVHKKGVTLVFDQGPERIFDGVCLALGGQSYLSRPSDWAQLFEAKGIVFSPFRPSNVGYEISWKPAFLKEAEGHSLKNIVFETTRGTMAGELMITKYGIEGTPVYALGETGEAFLDLKPDLSRQALTQKLKKNPGKLSPFRLVVKNGHLGLVAKALLFHHTAPEVRADMGMLVQLIKRFPLSLTRPRPLAEAISTAGGVEFENCDAQLMLKNHPGVFIAGEMLDWDAPTGGYLIQACVSQGAWVGTHLKQFVLKQPSG